ncbi:hypothetical protein RFI_31329 [Reticulomyxa filosa]|uniref:Transmembrane protein n=1 Tax=Reticulomyxa filosa TaxID=46433 RepID=X6LWS2_RETFI|nr:hypothetical protein RFI_31329 [Reticulomyxa filosa]|eukprot:ETO06069.1 hypothetical protein RFI_31329 [Reticulomyxa filosa]
MTKKHGKFNKINVRENTSIIQYKIIFGKIYSVITFFFMQSRRTSYLKIFLFKNKFKLTKIIYHYYLFFFSTYLHSQCAILKFFMFAIFLKKKDRNVWNCLFLNQIFFFTLASTYCFKIKNTYKSLQIKPINGNK